jgi:hypothetical protein
MLALFRALPLLVQLGIGLGLVGAVAGGYAYWHHSVYQSGWDDAKADTSAKDKEAVDAANNSVDPVRACRASGRVWRTATGQCE